MIDLKVDSNNAFSAISRFAVLFKDCRVENRKVAIQFFSFVQRNFAAGGALQPAGWAPLSLATILEKKRKGYSPKPLIRTGFLRTSFYMFSDQDMAGVASTAPYSEYHEEGTPRLPQRKMLPPQRLAEGMVTNVYGLKIGTVRDKVGL